MENRWCNIIFTHKKDPVPEQTSEANSELQHSIQSRETAIIFLGLLERKLKMELTQILLCLQPLSQKGNKTLRGSDVFISLFRLVQSSKVVCAAPEAVNQLTILVQSVLSLPRYHAFNMCSLSRRRTYLKLLHLTYEEAWNSTGIILFCHAKYFCEYGISLDILITEITSNQSITVNMFWSSCGLPHYDHMKKTLRSHFLVSWHQLASRVYNYNNYNHYAPGSIDTVTDLEKN